MESNIKSINNEPAFPMIFEGMISVRAIIESGSRKIQRLFYDGKRAETNKKELAWLTHRAEDSGFEIVLTDTDELSRLCSGKSHGGVAALCGERVIPAPREDDIAENGFYLMLEGIEDPFNFGFAVRSAYAAGVDAVLLPERNWMSAAGTVCRSSAGASERIGMFTVCDASFTDIFKAKNYDIICADMRGDSQNMYDCDFARPMLLVIGGEKRGISRALLGRCDRCVRIDYARDFPEALSAASAAAILCFEAAHRFM